MSDKEIDFEKLFTKAKAYAPRKGLNNEDAEEFAQECCIRSHNSREGYIKLDWVYRDFRDYHNADKRILSSSQGQLSSFRTLSLDAPIEREDSDSSKFGDFIPDTRNDFGTREQFIELEFYLREILKSTEESTREWAMSVYMNYLEDIL